jgi:teichuronic acid biosynthesis protein TuaE
VADPRSGGHAAGSDPATGLRLPSARPSRSTLVVLVGVGIIVTLLVTGELHRRPRVGALFLLVLLVVALWIALRRAAPRLSLQRIADWIVIWLPLAAIVGPAAALPGHAQVFAFRLLLVALVLIGIVLYGSTRRLPRLGPRFLVTLLAGWYAWLLISLLWAPYQGPALRYLLILATNLILIAVVAAAGSSDRRLRLLMTTLAIGYGASVLIGIVEAATGHHLATSLSAVSTRGSVAHAATGFFFNPNDFATFIAMAWPFLLLALVFGRPRTRLLACAGLVAGLACLITTGSRSSLLALGLTTLAAAGWLVMERWVRHRGLIVAVCVVVLVALGAFIFNSSQNVIARQFQVQSLAQTAGTGQGSGGIRVGLTKAGLDVGRRYYFLGVGPGNAEPLISALPSPPAQFSNLHDWWLEVLVDGGLPALLLYVLLFVGMLVTCARVARANHEPGGDPYLAIVAAGAGLSLVGFIIGSVGPSTAIGFAPLWILFGLAFAVARRGHDRGLAAPPTAGHFAAPSAATQNGVAT